MQTLTEIVAAVVVHSSAAAYSHFGVTLDAHQMPPPAAPARSVARTQAPHKSVRPTLPVQKAADCAPPGPAHADRA